MLPEVAHVVLVDEPLALPQPEVGQTDLVRIVGKEQPAAARDAVLPTMHPKAVQMQIFPAHGNLQHVMEFGDGRVAGDQ